MIGKIMAMEVLWNEETESISTGKKELEGLLISLSTNDEDEPFPNALHETEFFMHSLSYLVVHGKLLLQSSILKDNCMSSFSFSRETLKSKSKIHSQKLEKSDLETAEKSEKSEKSLNLDLNSTEEIMGFLCNEMKSIELREFLSAIQESIYSFKEVKKGKQVMIEGKSSLGKILKSFTNSIIT
jgi:hypothetical protein